MDHRLDVVSIDGEEWRLRGDNTAYLGMNAWYRPVGTKNWVSTDVYGRATMYPGRSYESLSTYNDMRTTIYERIKRFFSSLWS